MVGPVGAGLGPPDHVGAGLDPPSPAGAELVSAQSSAGAELAAAREPAPRAVVFWSGGKDSAWALHLARRENLANPVALLTTYSAARSVVPLQEIPLELIEAQAAALGLPLLAVALPEPCPNADYECAVLTALAQAQSEHGVTHAVCGDIFLADIRAWRDALFARAQISPLYPLWGRDTQGLAEEMISGGLRAVVSCISLDRLNPDWLAREFDADMLTDLHTVNRRQELWGQPAIDPCGENGEFQTFVYSMPGFSRPLAFMVDEAHVTTVLDRYLAVGMMLANRH